MKILAIDSSGIVASAAIMEDDVMIAEYTLNHKITHSQTLMILIDEIIKMSETDKKSLDAIAVAGGPGSFTGLRIGSGTAKGMALVFNIPVVSIPTVDALAYNLFGSEKVICPLMDARRNQVYTGLYSFSGASMEIIKEQNVESVLDIIDRINEIGQGVIFLGDGVVPYKNEIENNIKVDYSFAPPHLSRQRAGAVAGGRSPRLRRAVQVGCHALAHAQPRRGRLLSGLHGDCRSRGSHEGHLSRRRLLLGCAAARLRGVRRGRGQLRPQPCLRALSDQRSELH